MRKHLGVPAAGAGNDAIRPAVIGQVGFAGFLSGEKLLKLAYRHLVNLEVAFGSFHGWLLNVRPV
jgi:hypothetical protein